MLTLFQRMLKKNESSIEHAGEFLQLVVVGMQSTEDDPPRERGHGFTTHQFVALWRHACDPRAYSR